VDDPPLVRPAPASLPSPEALGVMRRNDAATPAPVSLPSPDKLGVNRR
jgi:hypothetical protein